MSTGDDVVNGSGAGVILDGVNGFDCFDMTGANPNGNTVKGLQITRCVVGVQIEGANNAVGDAGTGGGIGERDVISKGGIGIQITGSGSSGNFVRHNYIGTDVTGTLSGFGNTYGVLIINTASGELIGGTDASARNVISENSLANIETYTTGSVIQGNFIGTNASGTAGLAGNGAGVHIWSGGSANQIGGVTGLTPGVACAGACNLISGNTDGVRIESGSGTTLQGNFIGTNQTGTSAIANTSTGVTVSGGSSNTIGYSGDLAKGNLISGNPTGVKLAAGAGTLNQVLYNTIGTNAAGTGAVGNTVGVDVESSSNCICGNVLSGNGNGVYITGTATSNSVSANKIGTNAAGTAAIGNSNDGVLIDQASGNFVGGLGPNLISGNGNNGVEINGLGASGNTVSNNFIGTDASGDPPIPNMSNGVLINNAPSNTIGGTFSTPGGPCTGTSCNVISGNAVDGVRITGASSTGNLVEGNFIGTDKNGAIGVANGSTGVMIDGGATSNTVGGATAGARNVISGNGNWGVGMKDASTTSNSVYGNYIGTNAGGSAAIANVTGVALWAPSNIVGDVGKGNIISGNSYAGLEIYSVDGNNNDVGSNYIGTNAAGTGAIANGMGISIQSASSNDIGAGGANVISGNTGYGVHLFGSPSGDWVGGNLIGTNAAGTGALGNGWDGVGIDSGSQNNEIGNSSYPNTIAFNGGNGICVSGAASTGNMLSSNSIFSNAKLGIDLDDGPGCAAGVVTGGSAGGPAPGPNDLQDIPALSSATTGGGSTTIMGVMFNAPFKIFTIEAFSSPACDPSGYGEGKVFLGSGSAVTDGTGLGAFTMSGLPPVTVGHVVTATATQYFFPPYDTSEFSQCMTVTSSCTDTDSDTICDASDNCPTVSNVAQTNSDGDTLGNACDNCPTTTNQDQMNTDGDEYGDACEQPQCVTVINHWAVPSGDSDCDGWTDVRETFSGTLTAQKCMTTSAANDESGTDAWPVDYNDDQLSNGQDILKYNPKFGAVAPGGPAANQYSVRFDLNGDGIINGQDILKHNPYFGKFCSP
jgi:titin